MNEKLFRFKKFDILHSNGVMKVNTDGVLLGAWSDVRHSTNGLDIGTGTGIISLMLAQRNPVLNVTGVEIEHSAYMMTCYNFKNSPFTARLKAVQSAIQDYAMSSSCTYDIIVSNPPYFTGGIVSKNENKSYNRHTLLLSHKELILAVRKLLSTDGHFDVIMPYEEGYAFIELANKSDLYLKRMTEVRSREKSKIERILLRFSPFSTNDFSKDELIIYNGMGPKDYTPEFKSLTKDFYIFL